MLSNKRRIKQDKHGYAWVEWQCADGWMAAERLRVLPDKRLIATELRIFPMPVVGWRRVVNKRYPRWGRRQPGCWNAASASVPKNGVTARLLRHVKSERHAAIQDFVTYFSRTIDFDLSPIFGPLATSAIAPRVGEQPRRGTKTRVYYAQIASDYETCCSLASRSPVLEIAKNRGIPAKEVKRDVYRARIQGLLTKAQHGRPGGRLTLDAQRLLSNAGRRSGPNVD
jgi:hypothetical protein